MAMADEEPLPERLVYDALTNKEYKKVSQLCGVLPEGPLQRISIYNDTVLHVAAHSKQNDLVLDLLNVFPESLNHRLADIKNNDGNTILHEVATSDDMKYVAKMMVDSDPKLLIARNELGETPIFCAARHGQTEMFKFLAEEMKLERQSPEDSKAHLQRNDGTTVLHISVTTEYFGLAHFIARRYPYLITEKDQKSMTALCYIACNPSAFEMQQKKKPQEFIQDFMSSEGQATASMNQEGQAPGFIRLISRWIQELLNSDLSIGEALNKVEERLALDKLVKILGAKDTSWITSVDAQNLVQKASELFQEKEGKISQGSSTIEYKKSIENPLLLATASNIPEIVNVILKCYPEIVKAILECLPQVIEHTNKKSHEDPLFLATIYNVQEIVRVIISRHPQALEHTNEEGMNILHVAILYRHIEIFDIVVEKSEMFSRKLLSATDDKGNSLLHMVGQKRKCQVSEEMQSPALQLRKELLLFEKVKKACKGYLTMPLNKENKTAEELFAATNEQLHKEAKEWLMRTTENCTILSVFIATVAFAAAYTVPGGPDQSTGIPILNCKPFFVVFIIADVISLTLALTSVGIFLSILTSSFPLQGFKKHLFKKLLQGIICLILSVSMMAVAFGATIILIMKHNWKNVVWHVVAFLPVPIFFLSYSPLRSAVLGTGIRKSFKKVVKSIKVVAFVALVILLGLIFYLFIAFIGLKMAVKKACEFICKVPWIRGNKKSQPKSDTQSPYQPAAPGTEV